jgi:hypothetical protein
LQFLKIHRIAGDHPWDQPRFSSEYISLDIPSAILSSFVSAVCAARFVIGAFLIRRCRKEERSASGARLWRRHPASREKATRRWNREERPTTKRYASLPNCGRRKSPVSASSSETPRRNRAAFRRKDIKPPIPEFCLKARFVKLLTVSKKRL